MAFMRKALVDEKPAAVADTRIVADIHPEYWSMTVKLKQLADREDELIRSINELTQKRNRRAYRMHQLDHDPHAVDVRLPPRPPRPMSDEARALLGSDLAEPQSEPVEPEPADEVVRFADPDIERAAELSDELAVVREATSALQKRHGALRAEASRAYAEAHADGHRAVTSRVVDAMFALAEAVEAHQAWCRKAVSDGADVSCFRLLDMSPMNAFLGEPSEQHSPIRRWLAWAAHIDAFDVKRLPDRWLLPAPAPEPAASLVRLAADMGSEPLPTITPKRGPRARPAWGGFSGRRSR